MKIAKKIISYILAVIVSILMISAVLLGSINQNVLNKDNIKKSLKESDYYYNLYSIIEENTQNEVMPSGFGETVLEGVFTEEKLKEDVDTLIDCIYDNKKVEITTETMKNKLNENVLKEIQEKNYVVNNETQKSIDEFEKNLIDVYVEHINYSEKAVSQISEHMQNVKKIVNFAMITIWTIVVILLAVLFVINKSAIGIGLIISGLFFIILNVYSGTAVAVNNILLFNWAFSKTIIHILNGILHGLLTTGIVLTIAGIIIVVACEYVKAKRFVYQKLQAKA